MIILLVNILEFRGDTPVQHIIIWLELVCIWGVICIINWVRVHTGLAGSGTNFRKGVFSGWNWWLVGDAKRLTLFWVRFSGLLMRTRLVNLGCSGVFATLWWSRLEYRVLVPHKFGPISLRLNYFWRLWSRILWWLRSSIWEDLNRLSFVLGIFKPTHQNNLRLLFTELCV